MNILLRFVQRAKSLEGNYNLTDERRKLAVIRIFIGCILVFRWSEICYSSFYYYPDHTHFIISFIPLAASIALTIGLFTPLVNIFIFISSLFLDRYFVTSNLGSSIFHLLNLVLLFGGCGYKYSIDAKLQRYKIIQWIYKKTTANRTETLAVIYYLGFLSYALISLGAILYHFTDSYWLNGQTFHALLVSSYLDRFYAFFRSLDESLPGFLAVLSAAVIVIQSIFQVFMIPLILFRAGRKFVIIWGALFFLGSLCLLQLSYLPWIEFGVWIVIFYHPSKTVSATTETPVLHTPDQKQHLLIRLYAIVFFIFIVLRFPVIAPRVKELSDRNSISKKTYSLLNECISRFGMEMPNVFNSLDLQMSNRWYVIYRNKPGGELLPIQNRDGSRLNYSGYRFFSNHNSDILYFGNSLRYRRSIIHAKNVADFNAVGTPGRERIENIVLFDYRQHNYAGPRMYYFEVLQDSQTLLNLPAADRYKVQVIYSDSIRIEKKNNKVMIINP